MANTHITDYPLLQHTLENSGKIVYLCGAGASMTLGTHQNSWSAWLWSGRNRLSPKLQNVFDSKTGASSAHELIETATFLLNELKRGGKYSAFMDETIGALHPADPLMMSAIQKIWRAGDLLSTTNYDMLLEETVSSDYVTYGRPGEILSVIRGECPNRIIHLHGVYDMAGGTDNIIADGEQYRDILENAGAQFIQNLLSTYPIIIVGCGGTVNDPNLAGFMQFMLDKLGVTVPYFYLFREGDSVPPLPSNVIPICYGQQFSDLPAFLDELAIYRLRSRTERGLILIDPYVPSRRVSSAFGRMHFANRFSKFTGRQDERKRLDRFLHSNDHILWWGILGEGGIGKSRLLLEWMRDLPPHWYGFFARKSPMQFASFVPFTDTVIVLDYILGEEEQSARTVEALLAQFDASPYQLRLLFVERRQSNDAEDWLSKLYKQFSPTDRIQFEAYRYLDDASSADTAELMRINALTESEEVSYIQEYLRVYVPLFLSASDAANLLGNLDDASHQILDFYRQTLDEPYHRPLFLSIFIEVWVHRTSETAITGVKQLLRTYVTKETDRWKASLGEDKLVNAYLKLLAVACAAGRFNITDPLGQEGYLLNERNALIAFLDEQDNYPGIQSVFGDLFIEQDELVVWDTEAEDESDETVLDAFRRTARAEGMNDYEVFAFATPYVKLDADPEEVYLHMLQSADAATEEDLARLAQLQTKRLQKEADLPDHAWIIVPDLPDIIREYIVLFILKPRDVIPFTKLVRANSIYGVDHFLTRAIEDWPEETIIQQMSLVPPDAVLDYFEFYLPLLIHTRQIPDFVPVENVMLLGKATPPFAPYEMELWLRIAVVLTERCDWKQLSNSGQQFLRYAENSFDHPKVQSRIVDVLNAYCTGLHNAGQADLMDSFLTQCDALSAEHRDDMALALFCCSNRGHLLHLRRYLDRPEHLDQDWTVAAGYLTAYPDDLDICRSAVQAADEYYTWLRQQNEDTLQRTEALIELLDKALLRHPLVETAETLSLATANLYMKVLEKDTEAVKALSTKIQHYYECFPSSKKVRSAYASVFAQKYLDKTDRKYDVPPKILARLKKWSSQYPDEIEFQEAYFKVLFAHMEYLWQRGQWNEAARTLRQMEDIAQKANYEEYNEENRLIDTVKTLKHVYRF